MQIEALREMVERGSRENPHLTSRLEKAAFIVLLRPVESLDRETWKVASEDGLRSYLVENGQCECSDFTRHGDGFFCKHRLAVGFLSRLSENGGSSTMGTTCPQHGKAKAGRYGLYCPTKLSEGSWCKWRAKGK